MKKEKEPDRDDKKKKSAAGSEKVQKQTRAKLGDRLQTKGSLPSMRYC